MKNAILFTACLVAMTCAAAETAANTTPAAPAREGMRARSHAAGDSSTPSPELRERLLQNFDANKNGRLDPEEIEAAKKAKAERQAKRGERTQRGAEMSPETKSPRNRQGGMRRRSAE